MGDSSMSDAEEEQTIVRQAVSKALVPVHIATSRPAIKAYFSTILFLFTSLVLLTVSTTAYGFFYYNYIPQINLERPLYLQYEVGRHPYTTAPLETTALISQQPYDISIVLHMPRTQDNLAAGNFMLDLALLGNTPQSSETYPPGQRINKENALHRSRRSAIFPYSSRLTRLAGTLMYLPFHLLSLRDTDSKTIIVPMFEECIFARGKNNIPTSIDLEIQSQTPTSSNEAICSSPITSGFLNKPHIQIYSAKIIFRARFHGMRYLIYNHRILAFCVFTSLFYTVSISTMATVWGLLSFGLSKARATELKRTASPAIKDEAATSSSTGTGKIKSEPDSQDASLSTIKIEPKSESVTGTSSDDEFQGLSLSNLSDTPATFPTLGRNAQPLRYTPQTSHGHSPATSMHDINIGGPPGHTADDEDDLDEADEEEDENERRRGRSGKNIEDAFIGDSGIGTSMESENTAGVSGLVKRRASGKGSRGRSG